MNWLFIIYVAGVLFFIFKASSKNTLYVFSPLVTIYLVFAVANIYPLVVYKGHLPQNIIDVTNITCVVNLLFLFYYRKQFFMRVEILPDWSLLRYARNRRMVMWAFVIIILLTGFISGVTPALLAGVNVEDLRMTSDIGMGFLRAIPSFGIPYLFLEYLILNRGISFWKAGVFAILLGGVLFLSTAARGGVLVYVMAFFVWINLKYRGFKWYEYFAVFYLLKPIVATILKAVRSGTLMDLLSLQLFEHEQMIFSANTVRLAEYMDFSHSYLWGESYAYPLFRIIPRFLWHDKPLAIDYKYKEMVEYDFEGGGIYTTPDFDMFLNFGYLYVIEYVLWLLLIHWMYRKLIASNTSFANKMLIMSFLSTSLVVGSLIEYIQVYFLFILIFYFINRKWRAV